jgi:hypothetical protein
LASAALALKFNQVESEQHSVGAVTLVADQIEHREAAVIGDNGFAVKQERVRGQSCHRFDGKRKPRREVVCRGG